MTVALVQHAALAAQPEIVVLAQSDHCADCARITILYEIHWYVDFIQIWGIIYLYNSLYHTGEVMSSCCSSNKLKANANKERKGKGRCHTSLLGEAVIGMQDAPAGGASVNHHKGLVVAGHRAHQLQ